MKQELAKDIESVCRRLFDVEIEAELSRPEQKFGDFATNTALKLSKELGRNPREIAEQVAEELRKNGALDKVEIAGPGFINLSVRDDVLFDSVTTPLKLEKTLDGQEIVTEYSDPNPFKVLHVGHLYTSVVGDAISNLFEAAGANVHRVNYGGDVGLHVGKTMWAILQKLAGEDPDKLKTISEAERADWLAECYVAGSKAYEDDEAAKESIIDLNKKIYRIVAVEDKNTPLARIYWETRQWSYDYFDGFYARIGISFERYYPESSVASLGLETVRNNSPGVYSESDGAIVYKTDEKGLHTRVFITRDGLPTYEAKEVGLLLQKNRDYKFDKSVIITANEQSQYMQVVLASVKEFEPELAGKTVHLTHGMVRLPGDQKMSSRKGNFIRATDILQAAEEYSKTLNEKTGPEIIVGAVKYSFLRSSLGGDIVYDARESVNLEGNSGPYLQYAFVRANGILAKDALPQPPKVTGLDPQERSLARKLSIYPEVFALAVDELSPHHICTYLYELAQVFNRFYESSRVIGDDRSNLRLSLVKSYAEVLENGLGILGIRTPDKM